MTILDFIVTYKWYFLVGWIILIIIIPLLRIIGKKEDSEEKDHLENTYLTAKREADDEEREEEYKTEGYEEETYSMDLDCDNCGSTVSYDIPTGKTVEVFILGKKCEDCGCSLNK